MATHAALVSSRIPNNTRLIPSKTFHAFPAQCSSKRLDVAEFSGLPSNTCLNFAHNAREASFFDTVAAQLAPKVFAFEVIWSLESDAHILTTS
ncbi:glyceraldehyde-3-phosphate dehydrogenase B, chloroplastic-like [Macadamia integrifolia]|uniref:glyceraldehyde-3-phosphate dehydrogenase B, chloroplastic-like n=1 Tax=Macadamia integrifolia TaxID=60698 RepID=UPI001C4EC2D1|nr:glyceraldehyde-3-phosphate dehydrogenase B, chloroplastic-like [Macadamia integrifolia]